jgi:hypothetical protein
MRSSAAVRSFPAPSLARTTRLGIAEFTASIRLVQSVLTSSGHVVAEHRASSLRAAPSFPDRRSEIACSLDAMQAVRSAEAVRLARADATIAPTTKTLRGKPELLLKDTLA